MLNSHLTDEEKTKVNGIGILQKDTMNSMNGTSKRERCLVVNVNRKITHTQYHEKIAEIPRTHKEKEGLRKINPHSAY